VFAVAMLQ